MRSTDEFPGRVADAEGRPSALAVGVLVGVGLLLLAHPLYLMPHAGQTAYVLSDVDPVADTSSETSVAYRDLSPAARVAFDEARAGGSETLWSGEDAAAIDQFETHESVRHQGTSYQYRFSHADRVRPFGGLLRGLLTALGGACVVVGALVGYAGRWRPLTPLRALWLPVVVAFGLSATRAYDVWYSGASGSVGLPNSPVALVPVTGAFLCVGSLVRRRGTAVLLPACAVGLGVLGVGAVVTGAPPVVPLIVGVASVVGGAPWVVLGYWLTWSG